MGKLSIQQTGGKNTRELGIKVSKQQEVCHHCAVRNTHPQRRVSSSDENTAEARGHHQPTDGPTAVWNQTLLV